MTMLTWIKNFKKRRLKEKLIVAYIQGVIASEPRHFIYGYGSGYDQFDRSLTESAVAFADRTADEMLDLEGTR